MYLTDSFKIAKTIDILKKKIGSADNINAKLIKIIASYIKLL